ncbi:MAG: hypothetical protein IKG04_01020, partial [Exiguobacterium sp.]|nr:hypothetical protein [Exiguobacterium sp.]
MVSAELIHNPYLLETVARFNGREPKVNSAIERFEGRPLVEWADDVPRTFRDEMNGLDFDLYFTGNDADYQRVVKAFTEQGISVLDTSSNTFRAPSERTPVNYDVRLTHNGTLEDVNVKRREIEELLSWLRSHRNRWFEFDEFLNANSESLDGSVPYIIVNENPIQLALPSVSVETVDSAQYDLARTELADTPILFMVNPKNSTQFRNELLYVLGRPDVEVEQLFFCIHPSMNKERAIRVISDLGVDDPQVIDMPDDPIVIQYLEDRPLMGYIRRSLEIFRTVTDEIRSTLEKVGEESAVTSANRIKEITKLDSRIEGLRKASQLISNVSPFEGQRAITDLCLRLENKILTWRKKKTGVIGQEQIWRAAGDFDYELRGWVSEFEMVMAAAMQSEQRRIERELSNIVRSVIPDFTVKVDNPAFQNIVDIPNVIDALIKHAAKQQVSQKNDFF